jgi:hypothetical protein
LLEEKGCGTHKYYCGIVLTALGAKAAKGAVHCHQRTGRASWPNKLEGNTPKYLASLTFQGVSLASLTFKK